MAVIDYFLVLYLLMLLLYLYCSQTKLITKADGVKIHGSLFISFVELKHVIVSLR
jgi:hypothetical protein